MSDICDMYSQNPVSVFGLFETNRIVKVTSVEWIDSKCGGLC